MTYVVEKFIKGNYYSYLVRSVREGDRVRQVFVKYLGRSDKLDLDSIDLGAYEYEREEREEKIETPVIPEVEPIPEQEVAETPQPETPTEQKQIRDYLYRLNKPEQVNELLSIKDLPEDIRNKAEDASEIYSDIVQSDFTTPDIQGFDTTTTDMPFFDSLMKDPTYYAVEKGKRGHIELMSPDEYIELSAKGHKSTIEKEMQSIYQPTVDEYAELMKSGEKFPMPVIEEGGNQEGRHRAIAAKEAGIEQIPVLIVDDVNEESKKLNSLIGEIYDDISGYKPTDIIETPIEITEKPELETIVPTEKFEIDTILEPPSQPEVTYYHGARTSYMGLPRGEDIYLTKSKYRARGYGYNIREYKLSPEANILSNEQLPDEIRTTVQSKRKKAIEYAKNNGYDGVEIIGEGTVDTVIFNNSKLIPIEVEPITEKPSEVIEPEIISTPEIATEAIPKQSRTSDFQISDEDLRNIADDLKIPLDVKLPPVVITTKAKTPLLTKTTLSDAGYVIGIPLSSIERVGIEDYELGDEAIDDIKHELTHYIEHLRQGTEPGKLDEPYEQAKNEINIELQAKTSGLPLSLSNIITGISEDYRIGKQEAINIVSKAAKELGVSSRNIRLGQRYNELISEALLQGVQLGTKEYDDLMEKLIEAEVTPEVTRGNLKTISEMDNTPEIGTLYPELVELRAKRGTAIDRMGDIQERGGSGARYQAIRDKADADLASLQMKIAKEHPELAYREVTPPTTPEVTKEPWQLTKEQFNPTPQKIGKDYVTGYLAQYKRGEVGITKGITRPDGSGEIVYRDNTGRVVGVLAYSPSEITDIAVAPNAQRKGVASSLIDEANKLGITEFKPPYSLEGGNLIHGQLVQRAISEGKSVPPEVLKDYPGLVPETIPEVPLERPSDALQREYSTLINQAEGIAPANPTVIKAREIINRITPENQRESLVQIEAMEDELRGVVAGRELTPPVTPQLPQSTEGLNKQEFVQKYIDLAVKEKGRWGTVHYALKTRQGDYQRIGQITSDSREGVIEQLYDKLAVPPPVTPEVTPPIKPPILSEIEREEPTGRFATTLRDIGDLIKPEENYTEAGNLKPAIREQLIKDIMEAVDSDIMSIQEGGSLLNEYVSHPLLDKGDYEGYFSYYKGRPKPEQVEVSEPMTESDFEDFFSEPKEQIIPNSPELDIRNLEALPRGTGAKYLLTIKGQGDELIAKKWARVKPKKLASNEVLIDMKPNKPI